jgi:lysozyme
LKRAVVWLALFMLFSSLVLFVSFWFGFIQINRPSIQAYPVRGIDVSHHQGMIDWPNVISESGIEFAYIKASEGARFRDSRFEENWRGSAGIARGAYHFFSFCADGSAQAKNFLAATPLESELPPAVDVEFGGNCRSWRSIGKIRNELSEFLSLVTASHPRNPILYVNRKSFGRIVRSRFDSYPLWVRETVFDPPKDVYGDWLFWQYGVTSKGRLAGIRTRVDLNVFAGPRKDFGDLVRSSA